MNGSKHISDDTKSQAASLRRELESLQPLSGRNSVCRVPERIRQSNEKAYTLQIVSIGPFHYGRAELKPVEEYKRRYLQRFLQRTEKPIESQSQEHTLCGGTSPSWSQVC
ncbi:hypothetical protein OWV82_003230 [Melia azedarach]|uniref:Uncharacterized protein n=1 Tax=Melia azedarach TaxID=155640 RepID=A0ACC1YKA8_MELAZ|nr:hypothetical protein OWV82_003230 [Melia azedarach]